MRVFCPNSVDTGYRLMQFDWRTQSPQPSHTSSLMTSRRAVVEDLVSDVDARGNASLQRELAGVEVGAVADILKNVLPRDKRLHADPGRALPAHVGQERIAAS